MKIIIATHLDTYGPASALKKFITARQIQFFLWLSHPLTYKKKLSGSGFEFYQNNRLVGKSYKKNKQKNLVVTYIEHLILNIVYTIRTKKRYDLYIGFDNLNALSGIILKRLGVVKRCIYYVVDYTPLRFENKLLNWIYHRIESYCAIHCDETWNLSPRMIVARKKFKKINPNKGKQKVVPMGVWLAEINTYSFSGIDRFRLVYMGGIVKKQGLQYVLQAVPLVLKKIPGFKFLVIGDGDYLAVLKQQAKQLKIEKHIKFTGHILSNRKVNDLIAKSAVAIALYEKGDIYRNWSYYADPGKIKAYLGAGLPVLLSDVPHNAKELAEKKCGIIIKSFEPKSIAGSIISIMISDKKLQQYRKNAKEYVRQFDWEKIFSKNLKKYEI